MIALSWLLIIALAGGALALVDGVLRVRGRGRSIIGIIEIIVAALFLLSLFLPGIPFGSTVLGIVLMIVLVVALVVGGRRGRGLAIGALVLLVIWFVLVNHWIVIPGIN